MVNPALAYAIVGHMVGDYLLQNDWLATGKKRSTPICALHCLIWTACVICFAQWWSATAAIFLFSTHFAQDRTQVIGWYMRLMRQRAFATAPLAPWSIIVVDNAWHLVELVIAAFIATHAP
jgi:hypothetical protein